MEYEIKDEPQGLQDHAEGDRDGGLEEDPVIVHRRNRRDAQRQHETSRSGNRAG